MTDRLHALPLDALHRSLGARMVPFAGWSMPVQYDRGVMAEHLWCRQKAGLFDVSHMGQILLPTDAAMALETLVPTDVVGLSTGRQRYGLFLDQDGGCLDDLMIARRENDLFLVVNAATAAADMLHLRAHIEGVSEVTDRALLALQGPAAVDALSVLLPAVGNMRFMDAAEMKWQDAALWISRSGYTGEDGFEISVPVSVAPAFAQVLLTDPRVAPIGLGARDSLRLEAGLPLYGQDLSPDISPIEAGLTWAIPKVRRPGGAREGGFSGADAIFEQMLYGAPRRRVGLRPEGRAPMRAGVVLFDAADGGTEIGQITSGGFGPSVAGPIALGLVDASHPKDAMIWGEVRGKRLPIQQTATPFVARGYKR
ncbi:MAG: glycine cleavage system aminomethyltransferase GcvT [Pseudomonadota bacterium]